MGKNLLPMAAIAAATIMSGGTATPALAGAASAGAGAAAGGAAAAGAGAAATEGALAGAGALGATDALAAQGAAGLLGSAGAEAAGMGGGGLLAGGMSPIAESAGADIAPMTQEVNGATQTGFQGLDGQQYFGNSITDGTGMTPNSYTGGYDSMNGVERMGQRVSGLLDGEGGGNNNLGRMLKATQQNQQQPQQARPAGGGAPRPVQSQPTEPMRSPYDVPMTQEEMYRKMYGGY